MPCTAGSMDQNLFPGNLAQAREPIRNASFVERLHILKLPPFNRHDQFAELADANAVLLRESQHRRSTSATEHCLPGPWLVVDA